VSPFGNFLPQNKRLGIAIGHVTCWVIW
jgi:hypothetical protein